VTEGLPDPEVYVALAEIVLDVLAEHRVDALVIGGFALAVHKYVRATRDLDLGVNAKLATLEAVGASLRQRGYAITLDRPDAQDHLGGVLDIRDNTGARVQVVNYGERFPAVIDDALQQASPPNEGSRLRTIPLAHLIVLKIYAGPGQKSRRDITALLAANPDADIDEIRTLCKRYHVKGWQSVLGE
jgi:hypothetical protein